MSTVWDSLDKTSQGVLSILYKHITELLQTLPAPNNPEQKAIGDKLKNAMQADQSFGPKLDKSLESKETRGRIARIYVEDPGALNRAMGQITAHPENTAAIIKNIPLKSDQVTPSPAPQNVPPPGGLPRPLPPVEKPVPQKVPDQTSTIPGKSDPTPGTANKALVDALGGRQEVCKMQAQLHLLGYAGPVDGSDLGALDAYIRKNNLRPAGGGVYDDFLRETKARIDKEWNGWVKDKDNAKHVSDIINAGYNVGAKQPPNDAVKEMQIALLAMGGPLPRFGVDGIRGHETNAALRGLMAPGGAFTRMLDAVGIPHEWPSADPPATGKPDGTPKVTRNSVLTGTPSGMASYFTSQSQQNSGQGNGVLPESQLGLPHPVTQPKLQP